jgi:DNA-binding transcriptional LysR family regulator
LSHHVILDFETVTGRGRWSDWQQWFAGMKRTGVKPAGTLRFSHFDQVTQAALNGSGVAMGRTPHNARHLRDGLLIAPFGQKARLGFGCYVAVIAEQSRDRAVVRKFLSWLRDQVGQDRQASTQPPRRKRPGP